MVVVAVPYWKLTKLAVYGALLRSFQLLGKQACAFLVTIRLYFAFSEQPGQEKRF